MPAPVTMSTLLNTLPQQGRVEWIGIRPQRRAPMVVTDPIEMKTDVGIVGDRYAGSSGKRQVTLIQWEHLSVMASLLHRAEVDPALLRRNIAVSGLNLFALKDKTFIVGTAKLQFTGLCHPCSFMEETFGPGGYNAVRGHGGITAKVIEAGLVRRQDIVYVDS